MKKVNIHEAKARLSECLLAVEAGERVVICKRNRPIAELIKATGARTAPRPVGGASGRFTVPASFFAPLPEEFVDGFYPSAYPGGASRASQIAEDGPGTRSRKRRR